MILLAHIKTFVKTNVLIMFLSSNMAELTIDNDTLT